MKITSLTNKKVKYWVSLNKKSIRDKERVFLIEGDHLIKEAQEKNMIVETISCSDINADYYVTKEIIKKISNQVSISNSMAVVKYLEEKEILSNILILDSIQDPGNLGTIIRSAIAFDFNTIIINDKCVDIYNSKVIRATEGMIFKINILKRNILDIIPILKEKGYNILGTDVSKGSNINKFNNKLVAIVVGNEGNGLSKEIKDICDNIINIKMNNTCESLNAGVATSILMYEVYNGRISIDR